jgi:sigma-B regulation protein RsbU (phosphoserine phosphatase)
VPYVLSGSGGLELLENHGGMALGVLEEVPYRLGRARLSPGDALFLYTDGITEAMDGRGDLFGTVRLEQLLRRVHGCSPREIIGETVASVRTHAAGEPQADDITLLALRYLHS